MNISLRGVLPSTARQGRCGFTDTCAVRQCGEQSPIFQDKRGVVCFASWAKITQSIKINNPRVRVVWNIPRLPRTEAGFHAAPAKYEAVPDGSSLSYRVEG